MSKQKWEQNDAREASIVKQLFLSADGVLDFLGISKMKHFRGVVNGARKVFFISQIVDIWNKSTRLGRHVFKSFIHPK